jgi:hypothetical protein
LIIETIVVIDIPNRIGHILNTSSGENISLLTLAVINGCAISAVFCGEAINANKDMPITATTNNKTTK